MILVLVIILGGFFLHLRTLIIEEKNDELQDTAINTANEIESILERGYKDVNLLSTVTVFQEDHTAEEKQDFLEITSQVYDIYDDLTFIDINGNIVASTSYNYQGSWNDKEWFTKAKEGETVISNVHYIIDPNIPVIEFLTPIYEDEHSHGGINGDELHTNYANESSEDHEIIGVLSIRMPLEYFWNKVDSIELAEESYIYVLNSFNMYVAHPEEELILSGIPDYIPFEEMEEKSGILKYKDENNKEVIAGYNTFFEELDYAGTGWKSVVVLPKNNYYILINRLLQTLIFVIIVSIISVIGINIFMNKKIVQPINELKKRTGEIAKGNLKNNIKVKKRDDEIGELYESFNTMNSDIKASRKDLEKFNKNLEKTVKDRTKELEDKNKELETFNKMTIGRELKMAELKKKIKDLENVKR